MTVWQTIVPFGFGFLGAWVAVWFFKEQFRSIIKEELEKSRKIPMTINSCDMPNIVVKGEGVERRFSIKMEP